MSADLLDEIERLFSSYFIPDFGGYDWRGDAAVQEFALRLGGILAKRRTEAAS